MRSRGPSSLGCWANRQARTCEFALQAASRPGEDPSTEMGMDFPAPQLGYEAGKFIETKERPGFPGVRLQACFGDGFPGWPGQFTCAIHWAIRATTSFSMP
jgi:hypothetical protein